MAHERRGVKLAPGKHWPEGSKGSGLAVTHASIQDLTPERTAAASEAGRDAGLDEARRAGDHAAGAVDEVELVKQVLGGRRRA